MVSPEEDSGDFLGNSPRLDEKDSCGSTCSSWDNSAGESWNPRCLTIGLIVSWDVGVVWVTIIRVVASYISGK